MTGDASAFEGDPGRRRSVYFGTCRIDVTERPGIERFLSLGRIARIVARGLEAGGAPAPASVAVVLTDDAELADLNSAHMGKAGPTDVLSFPMLPPEAFPPHEGVERSPLPREGRSRAGGGAGPAFVTGRGGRTHVGDIAISVERAVEQAREGRGGQTGDIHWSPADELRLLALHGTLHLCGWDHAEPAQEAAMRALEQRILAEDRG